MSNIVKWLPSKLGLFSVKFPNEVLNHFTTEVYRHHLVCFEKYIPKHSFISWLLFKNRLSTKDKLVKWGIMTKIKCVLCYTGNESWNHLFFHVSIQLIFGQEYSNAACNIEGLMNGILVE